MSLGWCMIYQVSRLRLSNGSNSASMNLGVLISAASPIPLHAFAAMGALLLGGAQLILKKGTKLHKLMGWVWVCLMLVVAVSSFWIHELRTWDVYSPIHLLSIWTVFALCMAIYSVRHARIKQHQLWMLATYFLGLVVTGFFTFYPGRIMYRVLFPHHGV